MHNKNNSSDSTPDWKNWNFLLIMHNENNSSDSTLGLEKMKIFFLEIIMNDGNKSLHLAAPFQKIKHIMKQ